eukprot:scaffold2809_cov373-Prasinococcus_capsulatus_cf.AAC.1
MLLPVSAICCAWGSHVEYNLHLTCGLFRHQTRWKIDSSLEDSVERQALSVWCMCGSQGQPQKLYRLMFLHAIASPAGNPTAIQTYNCNSLWRIGDVLDPSCGRHSIVASHVLSECRWHASTQCH